MSKEKYNIEEVFKSELEDFEIDVPNNAWSNISQNLPKSVGASTSATILSSKVLLVASTSLLVLAVSSIIYITQSNNQTQELTIVNEVQEKLLLKETDINEEVRKDNYENKTVTTTEDPVITEHTKDSSPKEGKQYVIKTIEETKINTETIAPQGKPSTEDKIPEKVLVTPAAPITNEIEVIEVEETKLLTSISASPIGGPAPLVVDFSHITNAKETEWDFGTGDISISKETTYTFEKAGQYEITLEVKDAFGNIATDTKTITVSPTSSIDDIPNIFSPNNDFINDNFIVKHQNISEFNLYVYNKKGELVFETNNIDEGWNGYNQFDEEVKPDNYIYMIRAEGIDGKKFEEKGFVKLVR